MAILQFGDIITGMRGSVGGATYGNSASGFTKRNKSVPIQPVSEARSLVRSRFVFYQQKWRELTDDQRTAWVSAAVNYPRVNSLGITYYLTGLQLFTSFNINNYYVGGSLRTDPPSLFSFSAYLYNSIAISVAGMTFNVYVNTEGDTGVIWRIWCTPQLSAGVLSPRNRFSWIENFTASDSQPVNIWDSYLPIFGKPRLGQKIYVQTYGVVQNSGQQSTPILGSVIVAA